MKESSVNICEGLKKKKIKKLNSKETESILNVRLVKECNLGTGDDSHEPGSHRTTCCTPVVPCLT